MPTVPTGVTGQVATHGINTTYLANTNIFLDDDTTTTVPTALALLGSGTLRGQSMVMAINGITANTNSRLDLTDSTIQLMHGNNQNSSFNWNLTNVRILSNRTDYFATGNWAGSAADVDFIWNNVSFEGVTDADNRVGVSFFPGNITSDSEFNNLSFWNGQTGAALRGGHFQAPSNSIFTNTIIGPMGIVFASTGGSPDNFNLWASRGTGSRAHAGLLTNFDYRAVNLIDDSSLLVDFEFDNGANVSFVNPLPGVPTNASSYSNLTLFSGGGGARKQIFVATNPVANAASSERFTFATDVFHTSTTGASTDGIGIANITDHRGLLLPANAVWDITRNDAQFNAELNQTQVHDRLSNGIYFRVEQYNRTSNLPTGARNTNAAYLQGAEDIVDFTLAATADTLRYRHYSIAQQATDAEFGALRTVSVPPNGATDAQVETAREGGYDLLGTNGFETQTDISTPFDVAITNAVIPNNSSLTLDDTLHTDMYALYGIDVDTTAGQDRTVSDIVGAIKAHRYSLITSTIIGTTNIKVELGYSYENGVLDLGSADLELSSTAVRLSYDAITGKYVIPCGNISADLVLNTITTTGVVSGDAGILDVSISDTSGPRLRFNITKSGADTNTVTMAYYVANDGALLQSVSLGTIGDVHSGTVDAFDSAHTNPRVYIFSSGADFNDLFQGYDLTIGGLNVDLTIDANPFRSNNVYTGATVDMRDGVEVPADSVTGRIAYDQGVITLNNAVLSAPSGAQTNNLLTTIKGNALYSSRTAEYLIAQDLIGVRPVDPISTPSRNETVINNDLFDFGVEFSGGVAISNPSQQIITGVTGSSIVGGGISLTANPVSFLPNSAGVSPEQHRSVTEEVVNQVNDAQTVELNDDIDDKFNDRGLTLGNQTNIGLLVPINPNDTQ